MIIFAYNIKKVFMVMTIFLLIGLAALAIEVSDSDLAFIIKRFFFIDRERTFLIALSIPKSFFKLLPAWVQYTVVVPIVVIIISIFFIRE